MTYQDHLEQRRKWVRGAEAELGGFIAAAMHDTPDSLPPWSKDDYLQMRYEHGYRDGQAAILQDAHRTVWGEAS